MKTANEILAYYGVELHKNYRVTEIDASGLSGDKLAVLPELKGKTFYIKPVPDDGSSNYPVKVVFNEFADAGLSIDILAKFSYEEYNTPVEILTEKEKKYLNSIIAPFRERVESIAKCSRGDEHEFIRIKTSDFPREEGDFSIDDYYYQTLTDLPYFEKGAAYRGMEQNIQYTPEELKLGRIEDLEEDFGIPLTTLFKALNQFFSKEHDCYVARPISLFRTVHGEWMLQWMSSYFRLKNYGITWALTREELE